MYACVHGCVDVALLCPIAMSSLEKVGNKLQFAQIKMCFVLVFILIKSSNNVQQWKSMIESQFHYDF